MSAPLPVHLTLHVHLGLKSSLPLVMSGNYHNLTAGQKRKFLGDKHKKHGGKRSKSNKNWNPKRGAPALLLVCETGKERICMNEAFDILDYYETSEDSSTNDDKNEMNKHGDTKRDDGDQDVSSASTAKEKVLSLDDEIKLLQSQSKQQSNQNNRTSRGSRNNNWDVYQTGCKGTVWLLRKTAKTTETDISKEHTSDNRGLDTEAAKDATEGGGANEAASNVEDEPSIPSSTSTSLTNTTPITAHNLQLFDPIDLVKTIIHDLDDTSSAKRSVLPPSSRFVTKMIPIQITCFPSIKEIEACTKSLLSHYYNIITKQQKDAEPTTTTTPTTTTFAISHKIRLCTTVTKDEIINTIAKVMSDDNQQQPPTNNWKVQLKDPDVTINVQICKTLCGISFIPKCHEFRTNFNLIMIREDSHEQQAAEEDGEGREES